MTSLDDATKQLLVDHWLPRLRELPARRRPMIWLLIAILIIPIATAVVVIVTSLLFFHEHMLLKGGICAPLLGVSAIAYDSCRRLQSCNDVLLEIEFYVLCGDEENLNRSISNISCLGRMQNVLKEALPLLKGE